ncbi:MULTISPECIES: TPM domain-containing protein [unclassified Bizionia]|uniref:TPM domain-containing protein n=1 Tax=unclassified Bizionia TaxID=2626393 RepID=UPI00205F68B1|nr:TPM domain-containing protein [Bizionia sp. M204]UPS91940.1 TPM domain-containing protein [Bizionia sp. M204]
MPNLKNYIFTPLSIKQFSLICVMLFVGMQSSLAQFTIPEIPKEQTSVYDYIGLLSAPEKRALENKLVKYSDTTSTQIVVAIISSTNGENINYLGAQWGQKWGIGQAKEDNGVLILLARDDKKIAINTGYGVEHLLTDAMSKRIIQNDIIPFFKQNNYPGGLNRGADAIFEVMTGEYQGSRQGDSSGSPIGFFFFLFIVFIFIIIAISKSRRGGGNNGSGNNKSGGFSILDAIILSNLGRGGYGGSSGGFGGSSGGSFGGGGFGGGFGGGGFGGGGASGGW